MTTCSSFIIRELSTSCKGKCCFFNILRNRQFFDDRPRIISENRGHTWRALCFIAVFAFPANHGGRGRKAYPLPRGRRIPQPQRPQKRSRSVRRQGVRYPGHGTLGRGRAGNRPAMPRFRYPGPSKTAQTPGRGSGLSWRSFSMTPRPPGWARLPGPDTAPARGGVFQAPGHALPIGGQGDTPLCAEPGGGLGREMRVSGDADASLQVWGALAGSGGAAEDDAGVTPAGSPFTRIRTS